VRPFARCACPHSAFSFSITTRKPSPHPPSNMPKVAKATKVNAGGKKKLAEPVKAAPPPKEVS